MLLIKTESEYKLDELLDQAEISVSEDEYYDLNILMLNEHDITVDWLLWQMKSYNLSFQEALVKYIIL